MRHITITLHEKKLIYVKDFKKNVTIIKENEFNINDYPVYVNLVKLMSEGLRDDEVLNIHYHKLPADVLQVLTYSNPNYHFSYIHEISEVEKLHQEITDYLADAHEMDVREIVIATETYETKVNGEIVNAIASVSSEGNVDIMDEKIKGKPVAEFLGLLKAYKKFTKNNNLKHIVTLETSSDFAVEAIEKPFESRSEAKEFIEVKLIEAGMNKKSIFGYLNIYEEIVNKYVKNELKIVQVSNNGSFLKRYAAKFALHSIRFKKSSKYFTTSAAYKKIYTDYKRLLKIKNEGLVNALFFPMVNY